MVELSIKIWTKIKENFNIKKIKEKYPKPHKKRPLPEY